MNTTGTASGMLSRVSRPSFPFLSGVSSTAAKQKHQLNAFSWKLALAASCIKYVFSYEEVVGNHQFM